MFERRDDFRKFLAQVAKAVHRGEIELHCYCLMVTHYHLLLRSPRGELHKAMARIQLTYSRWFNRSRRRDGSLVRGRYHSRPVDSPSYRCALVAYIDANPCRAGMAAHPAAHPYGSAFHYARPSGPPWLERSWIEGLVQRRSALDTYEPGAYRQVFGHPSRELAEVIESRTCHPAGEDPIEELLAAGPRELQNWMVRKARMADGTDPLLPVVSLSRLEKEIEMASRRSWRLSFGGRPRDAWPVILAGLGRDYCGAGLAHLGKATGLSVTTAAKLCRYHREAMQEGGEYSRQAAAILEKALSPWKKGKTNLVRY